MKQRRPEILGLVFLALVVTGAWARHLAPAAALPDVSATSPTTPEILPAQPIPAPLPSTPEANEALKISLLLCGPRQPAILAESRLRESRERAERLALCLREHPEAWKDVLDLLCLMEPEESAVTLAGLLAGAVDARSEPELLALLKSGTRQGRCVALKLLSPRKSSDTLAALLLTADDPEPRLRLGALLALGERRAESGDVVDSALARRARLDPDPVLQDTARRLLGEVVPSRGPTPIAHKAPFSGGIWLGAR
jgi:hypothetical protein